MSIDWQILWHGAQCQNWGLWASHYARFSFRGIRRVRLLAGYPYRSCTWQIVTQMGHVSPDGSPHGHHSSPWCTFLLSLCIYNAKTRAEGCIVSTIPLWLPFFSVPSNGPFLFTYIECRKLSQQSLVAFNWHLVIFPFSLFSFFLSSFFATMFALPNGDFCKLKTLQHILGPWSCSFVSSQLADTFSVLQLACLAIFRQSLNFREFKTWIQVGTKPIPAFSVPLSNSLIA